jgi:hypothetical protein
MKIPAITKLNLPRLLDAASCLPSTGKLALSGNGLIYLDIDDKYIHQLLPLLQNQQIKKPDYFFEGGVGAHISVIYPEENKQFNQENLGKKSHFSVEDIVMAEIDLKQYYILLVQSPFLIQVRKESGLSKLLNFKNYLIEFHITIGVAYNSYNEFQNH